MEVVFRHRLGGSFPASLFAQISTAREMQVVFSDGAQRFSGSWAAVPSTGVGSRGMELSFSRCGGTFANQSPNLASGISMVQGRKVCLWSSFLLNHTSVEEESELCEVRLKNEMEGNWSLMAIKIWLGIGLGEYLSLGGWLTATQGE